MYPSFWKIPPLKSVPLPGFGTAPFRFGNSTEKLTVAPVEQVKRWYAVGTKLYWASAKETEITMGGGRIDGQAPFLKVTFKSRKAVYPLF